MLCPACGGIGFGGHVSGCPNSTLSAAQAGVNVPFDAEARQPDLVVELRRWGSKITLNSWGRLLSKVVLDAADEIERKRRVIDIVASYTSNVFCHPYMDDFRRGWNLCCEIVTAALNVERLKMSEPNSPHEAVDEFKRKLEAMKDEIKDIPGLPQEAPMGEPATAKFKIGDVVILRSGGPRMTVWGLLPGEGEVRGILMVHVEWFAPGEELKRDSFSEAEIEMAAPKEPT